MERLRALYPELPQLRAAVSAYAVEDPEIQARIRMGCEQFGQIWCPHTATAAEAYERLSALPRKTPGRWVVVATAHPAKFREIVEPLIGRKVPLPQTLGKLFARPAQCTEIAADLTVLRAALLGRQSSWKS